MTQQAKTAQIADEIRTLVDAGLLTVTSGSVGDPDATYALAWLPLDGKHPESVVEAHRRNQQRLGLVGFDRDE